MTELSMPWADGTGDGGTYTHDELRLWMDTMGLAEGANVGVVQGYANDLKPITSGNNNVTIDTGRALVNGTLYDNDASKGITTSSPSVGTTGRRLVLQKDWSAQTVEAVPIISSKP